MIQPQFYPVHHPQPQHRIPIVHAHFSHRLAPILKTKPKQSVKGSSVFYKDHNNQSAHLYPTPRKSQFDLLI